MTVFVDTSALFAILDADDQNHAPAKETWSHLLAREEELFVTNYVLVETFALVQRRLGIPAVQTLDADLVPILSIDWVDVARHSAAVKKMLALSNRQISLVDWVSFDTMLRLGIETAFAFDEDFSAQGFECIPSGVEMR